MYKLSEIERLHGDVKAPHECRTTSCAKVDMQAKNGKRGLLRKKRVEFARFHLQNNDKMAGATCREIRIPIYGKTRTPRPKPDSASLAFTTRSSLELELEEGERGKWVYFAVKECSWSDMFSVVIP